MPKTLLIDPQYISIGKYYTYVAEGTSTCTKIISAFNNGVGLEQLSEKGLEASNKLIRSYREQLSRKFSFEDNIRDILLECYVRATQCSYSTEG